MCECGCYSTYKTFSLPGPDGMTYVLEFGHGCNECETPAGVIISERKTESLERDFGAAPQRLPMRCIHGWNEVGISIASPLGISDTVAKAISEAFGVENELDWPEYFGLDYDELRAKIHEEIWDDFEMN